VKAAHSTDATICIGVVRETNAYERRVALMPKIIPSLLKQGAEGVVESGAGLGALIPNGRLTS
jgi:NAD(P) transhydrogenase subunit alpha